MVALGLAAAPAGAAKPPKGCAAALDAAKQLQIHLLLEASMREESQQKIVTALTSTHDFATALDGVTAAVTKLKGDLTAVRPVYDNLKSDYDSAAKRCRAGK